MKDSMFASSFLNGWNFIRKLGECPRVAQWDNYVVIYGLIYCE